MLSPDNFVQMPGFTQNFNRYSYVLNNPLVYTDPDGEWLVQALMTIIGAYWGGVTSNDFQFNPLDWNWKNPMTYVSIVKGAIGGYREGTLMEQDLFGSKRLQEEYWNKIVIGDPVFYARGPGDPNNVFGDLYITKEATVTASRIFSESLLTKIWYSDLAMFLIGDNISVDFHLYSIPFGGEGQTWTLNLLTRGPDAGFHRTRTTFERVGPELDWGFNINSARYVGGDIRKMRASSLWGPATSLSGTLYGVGLDGFLGYDEKNKITWIGRGGSPFTSFGGGGSYGWGRTYEGWW